MNEPIRVTNITVKLPDDMPKEQQDRYLQAVMQRLDQEYEQSRRDYENYQRSVNDARSGLLGFFGL